MELIFAEGKQVNQTLYFIAFSGYLYKSIMFREGTLSSSFYMTENKYAYKMQMVDLL